MKILNTDACNLMQRVGNSFTLEQIEQVKEIDEKAYKMMLENYDPEFNYEEEKSKLDNLMKRYYQHQADMKSKLSEKYFELYNLHDCSIISTVINNDNLVANIDCSGGFTNIRKIEFKKVTKSKFEKKNDELWILYVEIYEENNKIDFQFIAYSSKGNLVEMSVECEEILIY
ncbi:MAG: DUF4085 family protein [Bacilli bacterium]|nr:DUF4085 family protein [Bacilli bacterium]